MTQILVRLIPCHFTIQVERENHIAFLSFDQLFKNTKLARQREKETKNEGRQRVQEGAAGGIELVSQKNRGRKAEKCKKRRARKKNIKK